MKLTIALNKMANDELPDGTIIRAIKGLSWAEVIVRKGKDNSERKLENEYILKMMNLVGLNGEVEVIEPEQKRNKLEKLSFKKKINNPVSKKMFYKINEIIDEINSQKS